jgi:heme oxygenase
MRGGTVTAQENTSLSELGALIPVATGSLRWRLREATRTEHDAIEDCLGLHKRALTLVEYTSLLKTYFGFYQPLERDLALIDWPAGSIAMSARRKAGWLASDLADLGLDDEHITSLPLCRTRRPLVTVNDGLGALYVLEGATLGGQQIMRRLGPALGISASYAGRFFSSYGASTGPMWRSFLVSLEEAGRDPGARAAIERAAIETFGNLRAWLMTTKEWAPSDRGRSACELAG